MLAHLMNTTKGSHQESPCLIQSMLVTAPLTKRDGREAALSLMHDVRIIHDGLFLQHLCSADGAATPRLDVIEARAARADSPAPDVSAATNLRSGAACVMKLSLCLSKGARLLRYQRRSQGQSDCEKR